MQISHQVRNFAAEHGLAVEAAITVGLEEKAAEFRQRGSNIYPPAPSPESGKDLRRPDISSDQDTGQSVEDSS